MDPTKQAIFDYHIGGKVGVRLTKSLSTIDDLCKAYTPGVAEPVKAIHADRSLLARYTAKSNLVAVATDGTAVLGLGDQGAEASIPVMEGKAVLFKAFADVDGWPVPLNNCRIGGGNTGKTDPKRVIDAVAAVSPMYGGINLEDIAAPACFEIEDTLIEMLDIPVFHDDQWGTAVITLAGVLNYCRLSDKKIGNLRIVLSGAGAAGIRITEMLKEAGATSITLCDTKGIISKDRTDLTPKKREHAVEGKAGTLLSQCMAGADVFVGVSVADCVKQSDVQSMASFPAIFAMSNPDPEIRPEVVKEAMRGKPYLMATGRSDFANQVNNVLGFPFIFRGALDVGSRKITMEMKVAASRALAELAQAPVPEHVKACYPGQDLVFGTSYVIPKPFDRRLMPNIAFAVAEAAVKCGSAPATDLVAYKEALNRRNAARIAAHWPSDRLGLA